MNKIITDTFLIMLFTIFSYLLSFLYKVSQYSYYKIPASLIKINLLDLMPPFFFLFIIAIVSYTLSLLFIALNLKFKFKRKITSKFTTVIFIISIIISTGFTVWDSSIYYLLISIFLLMLSCVLLLSDLNETNIRTDKKENKVINLKNQIDNIKHDLKQVEHKNKIVKVENNINTIYNLIYNMRYLSKLYFISIILVLLINIMGFFHHMGKFNELLKTTYLSFNNLIIIDILDEQYICVSYDETTKRFNDEITVVNAKNIEKIDLKIVTIEK